MTRPLRGMAGVRVDGSAALGVLGVPHSKLVLSTVADHLSYVKRR